MSSLSHTFTDAYIGECLHVPNGLMAPNNISMKRLLMLWLIVKKNLGSILCHMWMCPVRILCSARCWGLYSVLRSVELVWLQRAKRQDHLICFSCASSEICSTSVGGNSGACWCLWPSSGTSPESHSPFCSSILPLLLLSSPHCISFWAKLRNLKIFIRPSSLLWCCPVLPMF